MRRVVLALLLISASSTTIRWHHRTSEDLPKSDRCIPLTRPSSVETARCVEDSVPVARLTDLILHQLHWHSFILISDNTTDLHDMAEEFKADTAQFTTVEATVAMSGAWLGLRAATGPFSRFHRTNVLVSCSRSCVQTILQQADFLDTNSRGRSVLWMTWNWLIVPPCEHRSHHLVTWTFNTSMNNVAILTPRLETVTTRRGSTHTLCPSVLSLTWDPERGRRLDFIGHFIKCGSLRYRGNQDIFPNMNRGFNGRRLTFAIKAFSFYEFAEEMNGQKTWRGSYLDLLEYLSKRLNFTYKLVEPPDNRWGTMGENGQWNGILGMVHRQEVVAGWAPYDVSYHRSLHFDFPSPPDYSPTSFIYRPPDSDAHLTLLLRPLSWQVLVCVAAWLPVVVMLLFVSETVHRHPTSPQPRLWDDLHRCWRTVIGALFAEASPDDWRWGGSRLMVGSWWLVTVVLAAAYSGSLVAHLSLTPPYLPFRSLEDVVKQTQYKWGTLGNGSFHDIVRRTNTSLYQTVNEGLDRFTWSDPSVLAGEPDSHLQKVMEENYVYLGPLAELLAWQRRDCRLVTGQETLKLAMTAPVFTKDSALTAFFSDVIDELRANGLMNTWNNRWMPKFNCTSTPMYSNVITLTHIQGALYVTLGGVGLSALLLAVERLTS